ncbi:lipocalin, partial [Pseudoxanthomonas sp. SGD-10]
MKRNVIITALGLGCLAFLASSCVSIPDGATAVSNFDQQKYLGKWYEIARMDFKHERNLNNVTAEYSLRDDGLIKVD